MLTSKCCGAEIVSEICGECNNIIHVCRKCDKYCEVVELSQPPTPQPEDWEKRMDEEFGIDLVYITPKGFRQQNSGSIKSFIRKILSEQEEKYKGNIHMLRQWLNEDRITDPEKMITSQDIKDWLENKHIYTIK